MTNENPPLDQSDDDLHVISITLDRDTMMALVDLKRGILDPVFAERELSSRMTTMSHVVEFCIDKALDHMILIMDEIMGGPDDAAGCTLH
ncbi:hypothetical protein IVB25_25315 [Bradyrhizobium sp. 193]|uniref:hypothetical protein n=1 Tax=Bradyrhizobium sp. 193 TaxID=2782661 RepID=UPI001FFB12A8|nr:hypothetical protein [Bradyrhizobium sp. 193]MCK1485922.1 hypothetical protein [Bradyrhizobium sp. 193]